MCDWAPNRPRSRPSRVRSSGAARPRAQNRERADARNDRPVTGGHRLERQPKVKFRGSDYGWSTAGARLKGVLAQEHAPAAHGSGIGRPLELDPLVAPSPHRRRNQHPEQAGKRDGEQRADDPAELETKREPTPACLDRERASAARATVPHWRRARGCRRRSRGHPAMRRRSGLSCVPPSDASVPSRPGRH